MLKLSGLVIWRLGSRAAVRKYSSPSATIFKTEKLEVSTNIPDKASKTAVAEDKDNAGKLMLIYLLPKLCRKTKQYSANYGRLRLQGRLCILSIM